MDDREGKESVPEPEKAVDSPTVEDESKDVETPKMQDEADVSDSPVGATEGNKSDLACKFATDEETAPDKKMSGSRKIMCFVIGFLVIVAVVITAVLLSYDGEKSQPAAVIPSTPVAPTPPEEESPVAVPAPVGTPPVSPVAEPTSPSPTQLASNSPTLAPTASPTIDLAGKVVDFLAANQVVVNELDPSATLAVAVLANETAGVLDPASASKIIQRFALLTVDFAIRATNPSDVTATGTPAPVDGNATATTAPTATAAPVDGNSTGGGFFEVDPNQGNGTDGSGGTFFDAGSQAFADAFGGMRHLQTNVDECLWTGVTCVDGIVTDLNYYGLQLQGTLPTEIGLLADLKYIDLSQNQLQGTIPEQLYGLAKMEQLYLHHNQLGGTISNSIGNWANLTHLFLSHNQFSGTIPATMASGSEVRPYYVVNLKNNRLTGSIPSNLRWRQLFYLDLGNNQLTGTLPDDLGQTFVTLRHLFLDNNQFQGTLPESYITVGNGRLEQLTVNNNQLTGAVPSEHTQFNYLNMYLLDGNNFDSMSDKTCRLSVFVGGENVEFKVNCDICICRDELFCQEC